MATKSRFFSVKLRTAQKDLGVIIPANRKEDILGYNSNTLYIEMQGIKCLGYHAVEVDYHPEGYTLFRAIINGVSEEFHRGYLGYDYLEYLFRPQVLHMWREINQDE